MSTFDKQTKGERFFEERDKELDKLVDPKTGKVFEHLVKKINCLLCHSPNFTVLFTKNGFDFVRCSNCAHVYVNPQANEEAVVKQYNEESDTNDAGFDFLSSEKHQEIRGKLYNYFLDKIQDQVPSGRVLDIGCSVGGFLHTAKERGYDTLGLELNERTAKYAEEMYGVKVERKLLHECGFEDNSFDLVTMFGVIEHLPEPIDVVKDIYRILKPGGIFLGICPNVQSLVCMTLHEMSRTFTGRLHLSYFSEDTLRYLFSNLGWKNENIEVNTCYTGKDSMINSFQFLDPFGDEIYDFLPKKFRDFILDPENEKILENKMNELGIGLKLRFIAQK